MRKGNQRSRKTPDQLRSVSNKLENLHQSLDTIFSGSQNPGDDIVDNLNLIYSLIGDNIRRSKDLTNFDTDIFKLDAGVILKIRMRYEATFIRVNSELKLANELYNKHKRLSALMN